MFQNRGAEFLTQAVQSISLLKLCPTFHLDEWNFVFKTLEKLAGLKFPGFGKLNKELGWGQDQDQGKHKSFDIV